jgi:hypothetical protein
MFDKMGTGYVLWVLFIEKNHKFANNYTTTQATEKIITDVESLEFYKYFDWLLAFLSSVWKCQAFFA